MDGPQFHVEINVLESAADGIRQSVADQKGSALEDLNGGSATYGHDGVHRAMATFCDRWNDGLDILIKDADAIGDILGKAAQAYRDADAAAAGRLTTDPGVQAVDD